MSNIEEYHKAIVMERYLLDIIGYLQSSHQKLEDLEENELLFGEELDTAKISWNICDAEYDLTCKYREIHRFIEEYESNEKLRIDNVDVIDVTVNNSFEQYIRSRLSDFVDGFNCREAYDAYNEWIQEKGQQVCSNKIFGSRIKNLCDRKRQSTGKREWYYQLSFEAKKFFGIDSN